MKSGKNQYFNHNGTGIKNGILYYNIKYYNMKNCPKNNCIDYLESTKIIFGENNSFSSINILYLIFQR